jgi:hypothetical protein
MSRRRVKPDELDLWNQVARTTERLTPPKRSIIVDAPLQEKPPKREAKSIAPFKLGALPTATREMRDVLPALSERLRAAPVQMDAKSYKTMQRSAWHDRRASASSAYFVHHVRAIIGQTVGSGDHW